MVDALGLTLTAEADGWSFGIGYARWFSSGL